jgi:undecaprenyl-diphosphatase
VFCAAFIFFNFKANKLIFFFFLILTMTLSDQTSSNLIKKSVQRVRPCNHIELQAQIIPRIPCSRGYSFTSSHATNHFALASYLFFTLGAYLLLFRWPIFVWAAIVSIAQVYVAVHFPLDIFFGGLLGLGIGSLCAYLHNHMQLRFHPDPASVNEV